VGEGVVVEVEVVEEVGVGVVEEVGVVELG
jgi:hypothetical protein